MIILLLIIILLFVLMLSLCRISAISDEEAEEIFERYLKEAKNKEDNKEENEIDLYLNELRKKAEWLKNINPRE